MIEDLQTAAEARTTPPAQAAHASPLPTQAISLQWHRQKYAQPGENLPSDTQRRVAHALALAEAPDQRASWAARFESAMNKGLLPGGRIMAGAGGSSSATLMNCFVLPVQPLASLASRLRATLRAGGGVGLDCSVLPNGVLRVLDQAESVARALEHPPRGCRRAAQMVVLRAEPLLANTSDAPDGFAAKPDYRPLTKFENRGLKLGHGVWDLVFRRV